MPIKKQEALDEFTLREAQVYQSLCEKKKDLACLDVEVKMLEEELSKKIDEKIEMCADIKKLDKQVHRAFAKAYKKLRSGKGSARTCLKEQETYRIVVRKQDLMKKPAMATKNQTGK